MEEQKLNRLLFFILTKNIQLEFQPKSSDESEWNDIYLDLNMDGSIWINFKICNIGRLHVFQTVIFWGQHVFSTNNPAHANVDWTAELSRGFRGLWESDFWNAIMLRSKRSDFASIHSVSISGLLWNQDFIKLSPRLPARDGQQIIFNGHFTESHG